MAASDRPLFTVVTQPNASPLSTYLARLAPGSRRTIRSKLNAIALHESGENAESLDWARLRYPDTIRIRQYLAAHYALRTANLALSALRGILKECWRLGLLELEDYLRSTDWKRIPGTPPVAGRVLGRREIDILQSTIRRDRSPAGLRDCAIVAVLASTGLRRAELVALELTDYQRGVLRVRGKGNRERFAYLAGAVRISFERWLQELGSSSGSVFVAVNKAGHLSSSPLAADSIERILRRRARQAGIARFRPHDLRRTLATNLLANGADLLVAQRVLGHCSVTSTAVYDRRGEQQKRVASRMASG